MNLHKEEFSSNPFMGSHPIEAIAWNFSSDPDQEAETITVFMEFTLLEDSAQPLMKFSKAYERYREMNLHESQQLLSISRIALLDSESRVDFHFKISPHENSTLCFALACSAIKV
mmetsp:Transcript_62394/g.167027  ORF Transcript_62394/g.167027 Transcript_62394/m.167027 type:complete len:115 (+) Transcript_62394:526-870(+)